MREEGRRVCEDLGEQICLRADPAWPLLLTASCTESVASLGCRCGEGAGGGLWELCFPWLLPAPTG